MIVPSFDTYLAGERVTAAKLNKNVRDPGNFFKNVPFAWAYRTAALTLSNNTWQDSFCDSAKFDNDGMFAPGGTGALIVQTPGLYYVDAGCRFSTDSTGIRGGRIRVNGADLDTFYAAPAPGGQTTVRGSGYVQCVAGDSLTVGAFINSVTTGTPTGTLALHVGQPHYNFVRALWVAA